MDALVAALTAAGPLKTGGASADTAARFHWSVGDFLRAAESPRCASGTA